MSTAACILCKIIRGSWHHPVSLQSLRQTNAIGIGDIPSFKLFESAHVLAFLDIQPLSRGHAVKTLSSTFAPDYTAPAAISS